MVMVKTVYNRRHTVLTLCIWTPLVLTTLVKFNSCHAESIKMPRPLLIFSHSDYLIQTVDINSHTSWQTVQIADDLIQVVVINSHTTSWQTVQIQISWLLENPTDLDLYCLQKQDISGFSRTRLTNLLAVEMAESVDRPYLYVLRCLI